MGATELQGWEAILKSDVAVSLLLLAALFVLAGILLGWARSLHRENRDLKRELIEHLKADADLGLALARLGELVDLYKRTTGHDRLGEGGDLELPALATGAGAEAAEHGADAGADPGDDDARPDAAP